MPPKTVIIRPQAQPHAAPIAHKPQADQTVFFRITTKAPLHIGCDEVYEPTSFIIDNQNNELVSFETSELLEQLDSDALQLFSSICKKGTIVSLLELLKFMRSQADLADGQRIRVPDAFVEHYESTLRLPSNEHTVRQELNNFQIKRTAFDPLSGSAYIPGSAIKGAIRTAVLNLRNQKKSPAPAQRNSRSLQEKLLDFEFGHLESDPFRLLKVSDFFPVNAAQRVITYAVDVKKRPSERAAQAPYQILETIAADAEFIGSITILGVPGRDSGIRKPLSLEEIYQAIRTFYSAEKQREDRELGTIGVVPTPLVADRQPMPLRVGRHSGAECVTVEGHRSIKIMQGGGRPPQTLDHATTIWLAAGDKKPASSNTLAPFGWTLFEPMSHEHGIEQMKEASQRKVAALAGIGEKIVAKKKREVELRLRLEEQAREAAEKSAQIAAEAAEKEAVAEKERQLLAAMSPAERQAYEIQKKDVAENAVIDLYNKLESFTHEDQKVIAAALKNCWEATQKWSKKQCSKKQWEKVQKIKAILGEA